MARSPVLCRCLFVALLAFVPGCTTKATTKSPGGDAMRIETRDGSTLVSLDGAPCVSFTHPELGEAGRPRILVANAGEGWRRVSLVWDLPREIRQDELAVEFAYPCTPDFYWIPHLTPEPGYVAAQHVFRSPAIIVAEKDLTIAIVPDLALVGQMEGAPWFLDLDAPARRAWLGLSRTVVTGHVGFKRTPGMTLPAGRLELAFFVSAWRDPATPRNPFQRVTRFLWDRYATPLYDQGEPLRVPMDTYVAHTYRWAFDSLGDRMWQEFDWKGTRIGGVKSHINVTESPNYDGPWYQRKRKAIWNQAWFSSLRCASGLARWARRTGDAELGRKAGLTRDLVLAAPTDDGLFPAVIQVDNDMVEVDGKEYARPRPWSEGYWTSSDRYPRGHGINERWYHVLDMSWTALLMLRWHEEIGADPRLVDYARGYGDRLLLLQDEAGFFPGWLHPETHQPTAFMAETPETSLSVTFLLKLAELTGDPKYRAAALRAMDALLVEVVPGGRWEDFESYGSCSGLGNPDHVGRRYERNGMYKQNNFSMFWTAEALLEAFRSTGEEKYLDWGRRVLDELSLTQQVWQPPFIYVPALGGFGVMNYDGEWNDSRQSLFAELYMRYYRETGERPLFERGVSALRASFIMMYCPENPHTRAQYEKRFPFFGAEDYGFMMENYGHGGTTSREGGGIGSFTIYDWGCGAACEGRNRVRDHFGDVYIDRARGNAFGIDSIRIEKTREGWRLSDFAGTPRDVRVVFDDGSSRTIRLDATTDVK